MDLALHLDVTRARSQFTPTMSFQEAINISQGNLMAHCLGHFGEQLLGDGLRIVFSPCPIYITLCLMLK
jgi:hypothetical protein